MCKAYIHHLFCADIKVLHALFLRDKAHLTKSIMPMYSRLCHVGVVIKQQQKKKHCT